MIGLGAAGVNIEDSSDIGGAHLLDVAYQTEKIRAVCAAVEASNVPIVVNARTDPYWLKIGSDAERLRTSIERANRYREAGAQCLFVPGAVDVATLKTLVAEIDGPLNVLAMPGCPPLAELEALGVRRVSEGSGPMRASLMLRAADRARADRLRHLHALPRRRDSLRRGERALSPSRRSHRAVTSESATQRPRAASSDSATSMKPRPRSSAVTYAGQWRRRSAKSAMLATPTESGKLWNISSSLVESPT